MVGLWAIPQAMMSWYRDLRLATKLICSFLFVALLSGLVGGAGLIGLRTGQDRLNSITSTSNPSLVYLLKTQVDLNTAADSELEVVSYTLFPQGMPGFFDEAQQRATQNARAAVVDFDAYQRMGKRSAQERSLAAAAATELALWHGFSATVQREAAGNAALAVHVALVSEAAAVKALAGTLNQLVQMNQLFIDTDTSQAKSATTSAIDELLIVIALAIAIAVGLGFFTAHSISRPLTEVQRAASDLGSNCVSSLADGIAAFATGDLTVRARTSAVPPTFDSRDEIGRTAVSVRDIVQKVQAAVLAYEAARADLTGIVAEVARSSDRIYSGAAQLAGATEQVGGASRQIARAISEVASGTSGQSHDTAEAITQMGALNDSVQRVADGAEAQRLAMVQATGAIEHLRVALGRTTDSVTAVGTAAGHAAGTAREGGAAVAETIRSIDSVRAAVNRSADQVEALGKRSKEIEQIVGAIDDIAAQTNLLALNAAIEAARAGEHGKGFTVVAAEVRKLAERARGETKEITQRINAIQQQIAEVVRAMGSGSSEVEHTVVLGRQARAALQSILGVVEETNEQASSITDAVGQMTASVAAVQAAAEHVARIATETAQAAGHMRQGAERVQAAVRSIAEVSEATASGAAEVSASTQEQTAGVEEITAGAQELATLATGLEKLVKRFTLDG